MKKVYLAGPMRGYPELNFPMFHAAAATLRKRGYTVFSPAEKSIEDKMMQDPEMQDDLQFRRMVFALDLGWICEHADEVALLPGWRESKGARAEKATAEAIGLPTWDYLPQEKVDWTRSSTWEYPLHADETPARAQEESAAPPRRIAPDLPRLWDADAAGRKLLPIVSGCMWYFPDALAAVSHVSYIGNKQHNPGQPMHWAQEKSKDHIDCIGRHLAGAGTLDSDGVPHDWKLAWRALAHLQIGFQKEGAPVPPGALPPLVTKTL